MADGPVLRVAPPAILATPGPRAILAALPGARLVGGAVRDILAGQAVHDIDLATPASPAAVIAALEAAGLKAVPTGLAHGTVTAVAHGVGIEVTTLRRDVATDGRHAAVAFTDDWRADAARRDFTINALSMAPDGAVHDYFGGVEDLRAGRVRFVGDPVRRIREDYLRIPRFFRFHAQFGRGAPDEAALAAIRSNLDGLARLSAERVWSELRRILAGPDDSPAPGGAVMLMARCGVLAALLGADADPARLAPLRAAGAPADPVLRLAALVGPAAGAAARRLKLANAERNRLLALVSGTLPDPDGDDAALRRALADTPAEILIGRSWLRGAPTPEWAALRARLAAMERPVFPLRGRDALGLALPAGPRVGALLGAVREWWLAQGCAPDRAACLAALKRLAALPDGTDSPPR